MRVIVCGSRGWHDRSIIEHRFHELVLSHPGRSTEITIVHGWARGADRMAAEEALKAGMIVEGHPANWDAYGKRAGFLRNQEMADLGADLCIAFWDGRSTGTQHMIEAARGNGIPVELVVQHD